MMIRTPSCCTLMCLAATLLLATHQTVSGETITDDGAQPTNRWDQARDPFWPIGYTPPSPTEPEPDPETARLAAIQEQIQWPELKLSGLTHTGEGRHLAIIEGVGIVEPGETIQIRREGIVYRWRVDAITARGINVSELEARPARGDLHNAGQ